MTPIERIRAAVDDERLRRDLLDVIAEYDDVREWAEALATLAEALDSAKDAVETWADAEGREERADAREEAIGMLREVVEVYEQATALPDLDLWDGHERSDDGE